MHSDYLFIFVGNPCLIKILDTTRLLRENEVEGNAYHHISRDLFNSMIQQGQFVEYGDHQKNLYGTSFSSIRDVVAQGKVCLLKMQPEVQLGTDNKFISVMHTF